MRLTFVMAVTAATTLAGCVGTSEIVPMGKDSYLIAGRAQGSMNAGMGMIAATKDANAYCAKQDRYMVVRRTSETGNPGFGGQTDQLIFSCVTADDPEYTRPNLHNDPTTVIQDARR